MFAYCDVNQPVINWTGLEGQFDFKLAILTGTDTEEARKAAIGDVITIEKAERPSEN